MWAVIRAPVQTPLYAPLQAAHADGLPAGPFMVIAEQMKIPVDKKPTAFCPKGCASGAFRLPFGRLDGDHNIAQHTDRFSRMGERTKRP